MGDRASSFPGKMVVFILTLTLLLAAGCAGTDLVNLPDGRQAAKAQGKVLSVASADGSLAIKPPQGGEMIFFLDGETEMVNFADWKELKKGVPVRVIHLEEGNAARAISVKILPEGSCD